MDPKKGDREILRALAMVSQLGISMIVPIVLCLFLGRWLDQLLGTDFLVLIFIILGILAAYRNLFVLMKPLLKGGRKHDQTDDGEPESLDHEKQRDDD